MENPELDVKKEKEILRVALDKGATAAYSVMVERLRTENTCLRLQPSQVVSFLVRYFEETHFEQDVQVLVGEFFDSEKYISEATARARGLPNFEDVAAEAIGQARKIKAQRVRQLSRRASKKSERTEHE